MVERRFRTAAPDQSGGAASLDAEPVAPAILWHRRSLSPMYFGNHDNAGGEGRQRHRFRSVHVTTPALKTTSGT